MEMGRYMLYANTTYMEKKKKEVAIMIHEMVRLMDVTSLTQEHINLITKTISWLQNIKPVFVKNSLVSSLQLLCNSSIGITGFLDFVQHLVFLKEIQ
jgi:hypothetical protein